MNTIKSLAEYEKIHKRNEGTIKGKAKSIRDHVDFFMNDIINEFHGCTLLMLSLIRLYIIEICKKRRNIIICIMMPEHTHTHIGKKIVNFLRVFPPKNGLLFLLS